jgi:mannose-6-phosphate isomerase-like protein (cupin superfamily)
MSELFYKSVKGKRVSDSERAALENALNELEKALSMGSALDALSVPSTVCALYVHASRGEKQKLETLQCIEWFKNPEIEANWSDDLNELVSRFFGELQLQRIGVLLERISAQKSLTSAETSNELVSSLSDQNLKGLYENKVDELNIDFTVSLLPFDMEVLDPRIVTVKPGKANEMHKHAHETVFIFLKGKGKVLVDNFENEVNPGDFAFIPRWCNHQSVNIGNEDLVFLAVADFGLTGKSFVGNYLKTARLKAVQ